MLFYIFTDAVVANGVYVLCYLVTCNTKKTHSAERYIIDVFPVSNCRVLLLKCFLLAVL